MKIRMGDRYEDKDVDEETKTGIRIKMKIGMKG